MASVINQINVGGVEYAIAHSAAAVCGTAAATAAKTATILTDNDTDNADFSLVAGVTILVLFTYDFTASNATLNVNGTGAYPLVLINYTDADSIPVPPGYFIKGVPYFLFFNGAAWLPVVNPAVEFNTW